MTYFLPSCRQLVSPRLMVQLVICCVLRNARGWHPHLMLRVASSHLHVCSHVENALLARKLVMSHVICDGLCQHLLLLLKMLQDGLPEPSRRVGNSRPIPTPVIH